MPVDGYKWGYEVFLKETDPSVVTALIDIYWVIKGGANPVVLFPEFPGRFELLQVKDIDNTARKSYIWPGSGVDFPPILVHSKKEGVKYYIV